jgi:hypothetical protein
LNALVPVLAAVMVVVVESAAAASIARTQTNPIRPGRHVLAKSALVERVAQPVPATMAVAVVHHRFLKTMATPIMQFLVIRDWPLGPEALVEPAL